MKSKTINLKDYKYTNTRLDINRLRNDLIEIIGNSIFEFNTNQELLFGFLSRISPINRSLKNNPESIELAAKKIHEHFGITREVEMYRLDTNDKKELIYSSKNHSYSEKLRKEIFRFKEPPREEHSYLLNATHNHLMNITSLVNYYSQHKPVQKFLNENSNPNDHYNKMILDYYLRCYNAQQIILNYYLGDQLKKRAIDNVTETPINIPKIKWFDFPYFFYGYNAGYYDYRKIDKSTHRFIGVEISEDFENKMIELYTNNKRKYYNLLLQKTPINEIFKEIRHYSELLPISKDRKTILNELEILFRKKRWISYYGIALSQIEGLFLEMNEVSSIKSHKALPNKVESIRELYNLSSFYFDYFQYHIPILRNEFMHGGLNGTENDKLNSLDFLTDIRFLLKVFTQLDNPFIKIKNILATENFQFYSIEDITTFLLLINSLKKPEQKEEIRSKTKDFIQSKLIENKSLEAMLYNINLSLKDETKSILYEIDSIFKNKTTEIESLRFDKLKAFLSENDNSENLRENFFLQRAKAEKLNNYNIFFLNYDNLFLDTETENLIVSIFEPLQNDLKKISLIVNHLNQS